MKKQPCLIALEITLIALLIASLAYIFRANKTYAIYAPITKSTIPSETDPFKGFPILRRIAACESTGDANGTPRQFKSDGSILWGNGLDGRTIKRDVGFFQINTYAHAAELKKLGLDVVHSEKDNITFSKILYARNGIKDWLSSRTCWQD